jgi:hypothetical protein
MSFSFPYPKIGTTIRPVGQGCTSCINNTYCPAVYWFRRYMFKDIEPTMGRACLSWDTDPAHQVTTWTQTDLDEEDYMTVRGVGSEAVRCGITVATGGSRQSEGI